MAVGWSGEFKGDLTNCGLTSEGRLTLTFVVNLEDKPAMWQISDIKGKAFHVTVRTDSERVFLSTDVETPLSGAADEAKRKIRKARLQADLIKRREARDAIT